MDFTHCVGIDYGTSSTKIVVRDLEFDEVSPVSCVDGRIVMIPSFVSVTEDGQIIVAPSSRVNKIRQWRFENIKGKILFHKESSRQIADDLPVICQTEGSESPGLKWALNLSYAQPHYELMLALKLSYLMRRVADDFNLYEGCPLWSLPLPVTSMDSSEALSMRRAYSLALDLSADESTSKSGYSISEYNQILAEYKLSRKKKLLTEHANMQVMPEGVCNIVAIASASFRRTDKFSLVDIGASTIELVTFSLEGRQLDIYHSKTCPLGVESLKSKGLASLSPDNQIRISDDARKQVANEIIGSLISPSRINSGYYKADSLVDLFMCGGGSLIEQFANIPQEIPESRLRSFGILSISYQRNLVASAGYELIDSEILPRYLVACGLSVPAANFSAYRLPLELANLYQEISEAEVLKPFSHLDDNWDYDAIK